MCRISTPKVPPAPVYAPAPPPPEPEPTLAADDKTLSNENASVRAKRRGARGLRTDLGITSSDGSEGVGLGIPKQ